jgi:hypothetical protein
VCARAARRRAVRRRAAWSWCVRTPLLSSKPRVSPAPRATARRRRCARAAPPRRRLGSPARRTHSSPRARCAPLPLPHSRHSPTPARKHTHNAVRSHCIRARGCGGAAASHLPQGLRAAAVHHHHRAPGLHPRCAAASRQPCYSPTRRVRVRVAVASVSATRAHLRPPRLCAQCASAQARRKRSCAAC